jgi:hypothetical protein
MCNKPLLLTVPMSHESSALLLLASVHCCLTLPCTVSLQVNFFSSSSNIHPLMMLIDGIFLVQVDLEELVISIVLEVLVFSL